MIYDMRNSIYEIRYAPVLATFVRRAAVRYKAASGRGSKLQPPAALVIVLLLFGGVSHAQSLDSLRQLLRENNPELQALNYAYRSASTRGRQQQQWPNVEVAGGVSPMPVETRLGPQVANFGVMQMLPWPGTLAAMSALADAEAQPLLEEAAARQLELLYDLETNYYELTAAAARVNALLVSIELYQSLREVALSRVENSGGSSVEVYRSELAINALRRRIRELEVEQTLAWTRIEELIGESLPRHLVVPPLRVLPELPEEALYADNPLVRIYALREEIARRSLAVNKLDARPEVALGVEYAVIGRRTDADPKGNGQDMLMPRFMVRFPLSKGKFTARREEEEIRLQEIASRRETVVNELTAAIATVRITAADATDRLAFLSGQIELTEAALQIARIEYANSRRPFDELIRLLDELTDYRLGAVDAGLTLSIQAAAVDRYLPSR